MKISFRALLVIAILLSSSSLFALPGLLSCDDVNPFHPATCPIDGGVSLLIAAGMAFGGKKALDLKNKKK